MVRFITLEEIDMNLFQRYLADEFAEDYSEGRLSRRDALKLIASVTGSLIAANSILASCAPPLESTETAEASPTDSPTGEPSASASPTAEAAATEPASPPAAYGTVMPDDPAVSASEVQIPAGDATLLGYLARPSSESVAPVILVCHENRGLTPHIQDVTRRVAKAGYVGLAMDLLSREGGSASVGESNVPACKNIPLINSWKTSKGLALSPGASCRCRRVGMTGLF
jgi:carboxymethylenebutenolidase